MQQVVSLHLQGGLKAVVWTDTLQQIIMMGSSIIVVGLGVIAVGGLDVMWQRSLDGDRIEFFKYVVTPSAAISNYRTETKLKEVPRMLETTALEVSPTVLFLYSHPAHRAFFNKPKVLVTIQRPRYQCCVNKITRVDGNLSLASVCLQSVT
jgi:hypothetical protein